MVTLDRIIKNVGKFDGDLKNHRTYERAKANLDVLCKDQGMLRLEDNLKIATGYTDFNLPGEPIQYDIALGDVAFSIRSERTTKKPQYKTAVVQMENYLSGISLLVSTDRIITGVAKDEGFWFIGVDPLLMQYELIVAGVKSPGVKQTIRYETTGKMAKEPIPEEMDLSIDSDGALTARNFRDYVRKDRLRDVSARYVKAYEKALGQKEKTEGIVPINTRKGYEETTTKAQGANWLYVVKTLVNDPVDVKGSPGELNILADKAITIDEKRKMFPFYDLLERTPFGEKSLYVGIQSLYLRIQDLKCEKPITANRTRYIPREIV